MTGLELLLLATDHTAHHHGLCIVYLKAKKHQAWRNINAEAESASLPLTPPATVFRGADLRRRRASHPADSVSAPRLESPTRRGD